MKERVPMKRTVHDPYRALWKARHGEAQEDGVRDAGRRYGHIAIPSVWPRFYGVVAKSAGCLFADYESVCSEHWRLNKPIPKFPDVVDLLMLMTNQQRLTASEKRLWTEHTVHPMWDKENSRWKRIWKADIDG